MAKFLLCPIDSARFFGLKKAGSEIAQLLKFPYEAGALNLVLAIERNQKARKRNKGKTIVILDEQAKHDENLLRILAGSLEFTDGYTGYKPKPRAKVQPPRLEQIVDVPHFSKSHLAILIQVADLAAFVVARHIQLTAYGMSESYAGERSKVDAWTQSVADNLLSHTATDPPGKDPCVQFFRSVRPPGWDAKACLVV